MLASRFMSRSFARALGLLGFLALAGACQNQEIPIGQNGQPISCNASSDCPSGHPCVQGTCAGTGNIGAGGAEMVAVGGGPAGMGGAEMIGVGGGPAGMGGAEMIGVGGGPAGTGGEGGASLACSSNADCPSPQTCQNGVCE